MNSRTGLVTVVTGLIVVIIGITIAYAALSTSLSITTNKITQSSLSWDVGFTGTSATASVGGTGNTERSCGQASISTTAVTVADTKLSKPDDSCTYTLSIKNNGTIPAKITAINPTQPSGTSCSVASGGELVCGNITYKLASDTSGTLLTTNTTLSVNQTKTVYLIVKYTGTSVNSTTINQTGASFSVVFSQN